MTRVIMLASSALLAIFGLACLFLPAGVAAVLGLEQASAALPLASAGALGFAAVNFVGRGAIYGGIYGRPIVVGNFAVAMVSTAVLVRIQTRTGSVSGWLIVAAFAAYLAVFTRLLLRPPFGTSRDDQ